MAERPSARFRLGFIEATVWNNENRNGKTFYTIKLSRTYKDGEEYKNTDTLMPGDLQNAREVLQKASDWVVSKS